MCLNPMANNYLCYEKGLYLYVKFVVFNVYSLKFPRYVTVAQILSSKNQCIICLVSVLEAQTVVYSGYLQPLAQGLALGGA